jgi:hypothetical protein
VTYDPNAGELLPDGSRIQTTTAGELADWLDEHAPPRECRSVYARTSCPDRCGYRNGDRRYWNHEHYRCDEHNHTWVYFPDTGQVDWFDLSHPARLIYPTYALQRNRRGR